MTRLIRTLIALCALASSSVVSLPAFASAGCDAFHGLATDTTRGPGGRRVGAGFKRGDVLAVTISNAPGMMKVYVNLLQYASPDGPSQAITQDSPDNFTYTVPADTDDYIYLNLGMVNKGAVISWSCKSASSG